jgi:hypothetical protein
VKSGHRPLAGSGRVACLGLNSPPPSGIILDRGVSKHGCVGAMSVGLNDAYKAWRSLPLPPGSADDDLARVHTDLVIVDDWVAKAVIPFVEHARYVFAAADLGGGIRSVRDRADSLVGLCYGDDADRAREYAAYADRLDALYGELERAVMESAPSN